MTHNNSYLPAVSPANSLEDIIARHDLKMAYIAIFVINKPNTPRKKKIVSTLVASLQLQRPPCWYTLLQTLCVFE
jgi:hypothetical protein